MSRRNVTFSAFVNALFGTFHDRSFALMSSSSENRPRSTKCMAAIAATGLLIEPAWNSVSSVTPATWPASLTP